MIVALARETVAGERRVALTPESVRKIVKRGFEVLVQSGAGEAAFHYDSDYEKAGARIEASAESVLSVADIVVKIHPPGEIENGARHEVDLMKEGATLISLLFPMSRPDLVRRFLARRITSFAMDLMPRITRAQSMDVLSSMSNIAGYKAVLLGASRLQKYFPMFMTAAGTITAARILILGAGVAGLQAIATARRLGAVVEAFDIRPIVKEQVESLGARFVELEVESERAEDSGGYAKEQGEDTQARIRELLKTHVGKSHVVVTTALIPGRPAPVLVTREMVEAMSPGSVIVDLAAEQGGNCELCEPGEEVDHKGVTILGPVNLPSDLAVDASQLYSNNLTSFLFHLANEEGELVLDLEDELTRGPLVTRNAEVVHEGTREVVGSAEGSSAEGSAAEGIVKGEN